MYHVSAQGVEEHMINVHHYYYYCLLSSAFTDTCAPEAYHLIPKGGDVLFVVEQLGTVSHTAHSHDIHGLQF